MNPEDELNAFLQSQPGQQGDPEAELNAFLGSQQQAAPANDTMSDVLVSTSDIPYVGPWLTRHVGEVRLTNRSPRVAGTGPESLVVEESPTTYEQEHEGARPDQYKPIYDVGGAAYASGQGVSRGQLDEALATSMSSPPQRELFTTDLRRQIAQAQLGEANMGNLRMLENMDANITRAEGGPAPTREEALRQIRAQGHELEQRPGYEGFNVASAMALPIAPNTRAGALTEGALMGSGYSEASLADSPGRLAFDTGAGAGSAEIARYMLSPEANAASNARSLRRIGVEPTAVSSRLEQPELALAGRIARDEIAPRLGESEAAAARLSPPGRPTRLVWSAFGDRETQIANARAIQDRLGPEYQRLNQQMGQLDLSEARDTVESAIDNFIEQRPRIGQRMDRIRELAEERAMQLEETAARSTDPREIANATRRADRVMEAAEERIANIRRNAGHGLGDVADRLDMGNANEMTVQQARQMRDDLYRMGTFEAREAARKISEAMASRAEETGTTEGLRRANMRWRVAGEVSPYGQTVSSENPRLRVRAGREIGSAADLVLRNLSAFGTRAPNLAEAIRRGALAEEMWKISADQDVRDAYSTINEESQ